MISQEYRMNRTSIPHDELVKYRGAWVAFSTDGRRIIASAATLQNLEDLLAAHGEDAEQVVFEWLAGPDEDTLLGAGEWQ